MSQLRIALTFLIVSALPMALAMAIVYVGSLMSPSSEVVTPWLIVGAVYFTPVWAIVVGLALAVYLRIQRTRAGRAEAGPEAEPGAVP